MPHDMRKKHNPNGRKDHRQSAPEHDEQHADVRTPFYDDPNHVAYGRQQMATLPGFPGLHTFVRGAQDDPPLSAGGQPRTWPVNEHQQIATHVALSGFNPHPVREGPRRPPPLAEARRRDEHDRARRGAFKPFVDPPSTEPGPESTTIDADKVPPARLVLGSKDVNQQLRNRRADKNVSTFQRLTDGLRVETQPQMQKLVIDELEGVQQAVREAERMPSLVEEPAPLRIRKKRGDKDNADTCSRSSTLEQARKLRAEQRKEDLTQPYKGYIPTTYPDGSYGTKVASSRGPEDIWITVCEVDKAEDDTMESLTAAITEWELFAAAEAPTQEFEHRSAVPKPLNLAAIEAAKRRRRISPGMEADLSNNSGVHVGNSSRRAKTESIKSFATGMSSDLENLNTPDGNEAEHNGSRRKWYRGFRRSQ